MIVIMNTNINTIKLTISHNNYHTTYADRNGKYKEVERNNVWLLYSGNNHCYIRDFNYGLFYSWYNIL